MPMTDDLQPAIDDLGAQLEAEFAAREPEPDQSEEPTLAAPGPDSDTEPAAAGEDPASEPAAPPPPSGQAITLDVNGEPVVVDEQWTRQLLALQGWAQALPPETRDQFAAIERGSSIAVDRAEFEAFQRWRQQTGAGGRTESVDPDDLEPDVADYVRRLEAERDELRRGQQNQAAAQLTADQQRGLAAIEEVSARFAERYGLNEGELELLQEQTAQLQIVPRLIAEQSVYSPSGQLLAAPDYATVFEHAFEAGLATHPQLRDKLMQAEVARRLAEERAANEMVDGKRARAASLASVPSAALPRDPQPAGRMSQQDMTAAIAAELRKLNGGVES